MEDSIPISSSQKAEDLGPLRASLRRNRGEAHGIETVRPHPSPPGPESVPNGLALAPPLGQMSEGPYYLGRVILTPVS